MVKNVHPVQFKKLIRLENLTTISDKLTKIYNLALSNTSKLEKIDELDDTNFVQFAKRKILSILELLKTCIFC